jgi:hypothetical protein
VERGRLVVAIVLVLVGLVWIGQGFGLLRGGSFMVDDVRWAVIGAACVVGGVAWWWRVLRGLIAPAAKRSV